MKTVEQICKQPPGSFQTFLRKKERFLQDLENDRKARIREKRKEGSSEFGEGTSFAN